VPAIAAAILAHSTGDSCSSNGASTSTVQLVCTGALTNAALLVSLYPELVEQQRFEVVLMGGALGIGNIGPVQEFNIMTDPEAARIVFESGVPITMVPLEVRCICATFQTWCCRAQCDLGCIIMPHMLARHRCLQS
jgi:inosine-uridine nucleoside N-ribohydrolase